MSSKLATVRHVTPDASRIADSSSVDSVTAYDGTVSASTGITKRTFEARARYLGERINLRGILKLSRTNAQRPACISHADGSVAFLYRYGALVFFDTTPQVELQFVENISPLVTGAYDSPESEEVSIRIAPTEREGVDSGIVVVKDGSIERLEIVAAALSKSVALAQYEADVTANFELIEPFATQLERSGRGDRNMRQLLRHIGQALLNEHKMVARAEVVDRPEIIWDYPELKQLYLRLEDEFELRERAAILDRKLDLISRTANTVLDLLQKRRGIRVEWYIVMLILLEIALSVYDIFFRTI